MRKIICQSFIFSIIAHLLLFVFLFVKSYVAAISHETDKNTDVLQNEVAFGLIYNWGGIMLLIGSVIGGMCYFVIGKAAINRLKRK